jgi:predicted HTH domain antitoxin
MGKALRIICPHCTSDKVVQNGHPHRGKLQLLCHTCHKYFSEDTAKGYPPTNIPFPIIAYLLYFRKKIPEFSNMRKFRRFASQWLVCLGTRDKDVTRQILHHWIKHYEKDLEKIISFNQARDYCKQILNQVMKEIPKEIVRRKSVSHSDALHILKEAFGKQYCFDLIREDKAFFDELCELVSMYKVYCWKLLEKEQIGRAERHFLSRFLEWNNG